MTSDSQAQAATPPQKGAKAELETLFQAYDYMALIPSTSGHLHFGFAEKLDVGFCDRVTVVARAKGDPVSDEQNSPHRKESTLFSSSLIYDPDRKSGFSLLPFLSQAEKDDILFLKRIAFYCTSRDKLCSMRGKFYIIIKAKLDDNSIELAEEGAGSPHSFFAVLQKMRDTQNDLTEAKRLGSDYEDLYRLEESMDGHIQGMKGLLDGVVAAQKIKQETEGHDEDPAIPFIVVFDIHLERTGLCFFRLNKDDTHPLLHPIFNRDDTHYAEVPRHYKLMAYFIKSILHRHYHHPAENDSIIGVSSTKYPPEDVLEHQLGFFRKAAININRDEMVIDHDANGILVYARSLVSIFRGYCIIDEDKKERYLASLSNLSDSIKIQKDKILSRKFFGLLAVGYSATLQRLVAIFTLYVLVIKKLLPDGWVSFLDSQRIIVIGSLVVLSLCIEHLLFRHHENSSFFAKFSQCFHLQDGFTKKCPSRSRYTTPMRARLYYYLKMVTGSMSFDNVFLGIGKGSSVVFYLLTAALFYLIYLIVLSL